MSRVRSLGPTEELRVYFQCEAAVPSPELMRGGSYSCNPKEPRYPSELYRDYDDGPLLMETVRRRIRVTAWNLGDAHEDNVETVLRWYTLPPHDQRRTKPPRWATETSRVNRVWSEYLRVRKLPECEYPDWKPRRTLKVSHDHTKPGERQGLKDWMTSTLRKTFERVGVL